MSVTITFQKKHFLMMGLIIAIPFLFIAITNIMAVESDGQFHTMSEILMGNLDMQGGNITNVNSLVLTPQTTDPVSGTEGEIIYNSNEKTFKYYNGISWRKIESENVLLSWTGSTHFEAQCTAISGTIHDAGATGTICRYPGSSVPDGWNQADNWQRYASATWGGDYCGRHLADGPITWSNIEAHEPTHVASYDGVTSTCSGYSSYWISNYGWFIGKKEYWNLKTINNPSTNRVEIGIY